MQRIFLWQPGQENEKEVENETLLQQMTEFYDAQETMRINAIKERETVTELKEEMKEMSKKEYVILDILTMALQQQGTHFRKYVSH